jgi:hypothetical protein
MTRRTCPLAVSVTALLLFAFLAQSWADIARWRRDPKAEAEALKEAQKPRLASLHLRRTLPEFSFTEVPLGDARSSSCKT